MRLVQVAKALGMTGQQLRHELMQVNFGIKPTDREIPDNLAQGVIRFIARKHGITVDMQALGMQVEEDHDVARPPSTERQAGEASQPPASAPVEPPPSGGVGVHVLRKLSLDDVPKEAIQRQKEQLKRHLTKAEKEEELRDRSSQRPPVRRKAAAPQHQEQIKKKEGTVLLPAQVSVKEFAEKTGVQVPKVIQTLMQNGVLATINQTIDFDTAAIVANDLGVQVQRAQASVSAEHLHTMNLAELLKDEPENLVPRPPIVVVMGHVDHGKTSILDAIRQTDVAASESGGITQHIGAYQVEYATGSERRKITFLDTPGHEAFTAMRARGAQVTDIAVIVVSAEEGVKPTTIEAIHHAQEAKVPIVVAVNKIDRPNADPDRVKGEMAAQGLQPEEWGGTVPFVLCSAVTRQGIPDLLDALSVVAEIRGCKANPNRRAVCTVIESHLDPALGPLGTVIVNTGTLRCGESFVCGTGMGRVRSLMDAHGAQLQSAEPSAAVRVAGFHEVPHVGDILQVVASEKEARALYEQIRERRSLQRKRSFADLVSRLSEGRLQQLKVVLKADAQGSLEALQDALAKQSTDEVQTKVIHAGIGGVSESDVMLAASSDGMVIAFRVPVQPSVMRTAEREGVQVRSYDVVYALLEDVDGLLKGLVEPEEHEQVLGHVEVKAVFMTKKTEQVIGGRVTDGVIKRLPFRVYRSGAETGSGRITSLRHVDKDIKEAKEGSECGMRVESTVPVQEGDVLEVYLRELKRKDRGA